MSHKNHMSQHNSIVEIEMVANDISTQKHNEEKNTDLLNV